MLDGTTELGRHINWEQVERHVTSTILQMNNNGMSKGITSVQLWGDISSNDNEVDDSASSDDV